MKKALIFVIVAGLLGCENLENKSTSASAAKAPPASRQSDPADWCAGHGLPESMCTKCNPGLVDHFQGTGDWCVEHGFPESACPFCNPMKAPGGSATAVSASAAPSGVRPGTRIRIKSAGIERAAGIETVPVTRDAIGSVIDCTARIDFDGDRLADVRSPVPGIVRMVTADLGRKVAAGDALFTLESARIGDLQARRQAARERVEAARANHDRHSKLRQGAISSQRQVELARQELQAAEAVLRSIEQSLKMSGASRSARFGRFRVFAPIDGIVVRRPALLGAYAGEADSLATVVDTSVMWVLLAIPEWDAAVLRPGQAAELSVDGVAGRMFTGTIIWVASEVDARTRTVAARANVQNPNGVLRAGQFARATIRIDSPQEAVAVPVRSVQRVGKESLVFVRTAEGVFEPRVVSLGRSDGRRVQVSGNVRVGDLVVTTGAYLLRTELSRDSIGAGCCEAAPPGGK